VVWLALVCGNSSSDQAAATAAAAVAAAVVCLQCVKGKLRGGTTWLGIWAGVLIVVLTYYEVKAAIM
jgi:hypothetical protein